MVRDSITVVVEQPLDVVGSVVVPVAAIVISAVIAALIAGAERRAARRERRDVALANLMRSLTLVDSIAPDRASRSERNRRLNDFVAMANVAESVFPKKEYPVLALAVAIVLRDANRGRHRLSFAARAALALLSDWDQGQVDMEEVRGHLESLTEWDRGFVVSDWREAIVRGGTGPTRKELVAAVIGALRTAPRSRG
ncbi:hypothetical protein MicroSTF_14195 [Microbacterium sp. STF-2]|uniref:hypothetical protein n=1 Tax=Microbacterium sp. STF-2 TaxID=3031132 RepID=UPI002AFE0087|nr:hypothetical protein [Microbacterium sp. STF-2]MEA1264190.1 hypothetical protein [Microbacterium sp. STF-2]